ncbi:hypothetical protein [Shinella zoogloeoides]|uniref:hypothetical protein n=1 Tax=Shinella zoogloeoides TaxID=352475 RepID=UPI00273E0850|nr:hypothetical protein [Shinella zoogloeoides]WLR91018.1 hypothetical protein Q9316_00285 [Shinella zoogloeoides]
MAKALKDHLASDNWCIRRRWMKVILGWAMINVQYLIVWGDDNELNQNALISMLGLVAAISGSYIFGAVWDDNDKRKWHGRRERPDPELGE